MLTGLVKTGELVNPSIGQQRSQQSQYHTPSMEQHNSNSCQQSSAYIYSTHALTSNWFWVGPRLLSLHLFTCVPTYMRNTRTQSCTQPNEQGEWGGWYKPLRGLPWGPEWHMHWVCYPVCQRPILETNTRHHVNHALSRIRETKSDTTCTPGLFCSTIIP